MIKAMKRLKIWSRKKRKKKACNSLPYYPPPPPPPSRPPPPPPPPQTNHHFYCSCSRAEPSAPPLPQSLWFASEDEASDTILAAEGVQVAAPEFDYAAMPDDEISNSSYQQYMVPNPVYGIPVSTRNAKTERSGGLFGCVLDFGIHLIRCFIPYYRIKEVE